MVKELGILLELPLSFQRRINLSANHIDKQNIICAFINGAIETVINFFDRIEINEKEIYTVLDYNLSEWSSNIIEIVCTNEDNEYNHDEFERLNYNFEHFFNDIKEIEMLDLYYSFKRAISDKSPDFDNYGWEVDFLEHLGKILVEVNITRN